MRTAVDRFDELSGRPARHGGPLRREGQPRPAAARRAGALSAAASTSRARPRCGPRSLPAPRPTTLVYSNPVKRRDHIVESAALGVRLFVVDSFAETAEGGRERTRQRRCSAAWSPRARARTGRCPASTAAPPTRPSTCSPSPTQLGPRRCRRLASTSAPSSATPRPGAAPSPPPARVFEMLRDRGLQPAVARPGRRVPGGVRRRLPARSRRTARPSGATSTEHFGDRPTPAPSSSRDAAIVGDAGTLVSSVIGVIDRGGVRWVYLDAGVFTGLVETLGRGHPLPAHDLRGRRIQPDPACWRDRRATAPTCSTRTGWCRCRSPSPRATRCGCPACSRLHDLLLERGVQRVRSPAHGC